MSHSLTAPLSQLPIQEESFALFLVLVLAAFFFVNYFAGRMYNVAKGRRITSITKNAISDLDSSPQLRWTTKAIVFAGSTKDKPVSEYRLSLFLMGRENIFNWAIARLAGRSDMGIFTANLPKTPRTQFDAIRKDTPPHRALRKGKQALYYSDAGDMVVRELAGERRTIASLLSLISKQSRIWTFSVRRDEPELVVNMTMQGVSEGEARAALQTILLVCDKINGPQL